MGIELGNYMLCPSAEAVKKQIDTINIFKNVITELIKRKNSIYFYFK